MTQHTAYVVLYLPPDGGDAELQGAGSARIEAANLAVKCAESILGTAIWNEPAQAWIGDGGGAVVVRPVDFVWPVEKEDEEEAEEAAAGGTD